MCCLKIYWNFVDTFFKAEKESEILDSTFVSGCGMESTYVCCIYAPLFGTFGLYCC